MSAHQAILDVVQDYFEGIYHGDVERLRGAFHPQAALFGDVRGQPYLKSLDEYLSIVANRKSPRELGEAFRMKALSVEVQGNIGCAKVACPMLGYNYIDFLNFVCVDGRWQIANKTFVDVPV